MNNNSSDMSFSELRSKSVIDISEGRNLGHITDIIFSQCDARVKGIVAPYGKKGLFCKGQEIFIPWSCIKSIGADVIIVDISALSSKQTCKPQCDYQRIDRDDCKNDKAAIDKHCAPSCPDHVCQEPNCDKRCDKCMSYDCQFRWKGKAF